MRRSLAPGSHCAQGVSPERPQSVPRGSGCSRPAPAPRREPERTPLYAVVQGELETYLARAHERERVVPRFVERELRAYLRCGLLCHGFVRVRCRSCGHDRLVAFSCKGRGFCPSCVGRRMSDTAAHLVDRVLPEAPVRQWVLSLPHALRYRLAYDAKLSSALLSVFIRTVFAALRRRARGPRCAQVAGLSLHANVSVPARDCKRLERLCRYVARPPLASERLSRLPDGHLLYRLKHRWRDGTTHVVFAPLELLERLVALIPPPRANQVRYHGVLAPASRWRAGVTRDRRAPPDAEHSAAAPLDLTRGPAPKARVVGSPGSPAPGLPSPASPDRPLLAPALLIAPAATGPSIPGPRSTSSPPRDRRLSWAELMQRVFARDVLECPACGGRMRVIAAIEQPSVIEAILRSQGLATRAPPTAPARANELPLFADGLFSDDDLDPHHHLEDPRPSSSG
jgi:hypothetical protein